MNMKNQRQFYTSTDIAASTEVPVTCYTMDDHNQDRSRLKEERIN